MKGFFDDNQQSETNKQIAQLEKHIDQLEEEVFNLKTDARHNDVILYELKSMLSNIYRACGEQLEAQEEDQKLETDELLKNLRENIHKMVEEYRIEL